MIYKASIMHKKKAKQRWGIVFAIPACILVLAFMIIPIFIVFVFSFTSWDGIKEINFIGFDNFVKILTTSEFWSIIKNNFIFMFIGAPIWTITPLIVAVLLYEEIKGFRIFRTIYLLPSVLAASVIGVIFVSFFGLDGPFNQILKAIGLDFMALYWFGSAKTAIPMIINMINWAGFGTTALIYISGMSSIDTSVYESAYIDGAKWWTRFFRITLPMIYNVISFVFILNIIASFTSLFNYVFVTTKGGPGYETTVIEYLIYLKGFKTHEFGYACALSAVMFIMVFAISIIVLALSRRKKI